MVKNDYENQLTSIYENEKYLRLLHGKFFRKVKLHQEGNCEILEIMRYILNNTNYTDTIKDGKIFNEPISEDLEEYKESTKKIFDCISNYIISLFKNNGLDLKTHYESMKIKSDKNNRGIYLKKCTNISTEEKILSIFMEKLERLPIAQNILICSKETTIEEIQSFFYRAILCDQNTLFVVEILDTFSNFQHNKMYGYIDKLLSYKFNKAKKENKDNNNMDKSRSKDYLDSCIIFVYKQLENEEAFKKELEKYIKTKEQKEVGDSNPKNLGILDDENNKKIEDLNISGIFNDSINIIKDADKLNKIKVISSDYCGLGKSFKIKKMLKEDQYYYHFPLGGMLTKKTIYEKLFNLFKKIKNDAKKRKEEKMSKEKKENKNEDVSKELSNEQYSEFNNIVIHLDLIESEETSLINEFLFSFLITKFYTNNEDIIYIPNNFDIYIEIPNSFEDYLEKYGILNAFNIENIVFGEVKKNEKRNIKNISMLELELDEDTKNYFKITIGKGTNTEIQQFIKENIGIERYSYHQVHTFIKLFISNFKVFDGKLTFSNSKGDNITKDCIKYFAKSTQYFTNSGFARLIMNYYSKQKDKKKDKFDFCLDAYQSDFNEKNKTPLIFIDKDKKTFNFEILPEIEKEEIQEDKNNKKIINKVVDIVYLIDATGSMSYEINAATENVVLVLNELKKSYKDYDFQFGAVFYRDKIDSENDKDDYFPLTNNMEDLKKKISKIEAYGGGDGPEDWVGGYDLALHKMGWRNGIKLIIHIADYGAHGEEFSTGDRHPEQGKLLPPLIEKCANENINIIGFKISDDPKQSFDKISELYNDYKLHNKDNGQFIEIFEFERKSKEAVSENFKKLVIEASNQVINPSIKFLKRLKKILYIPNEVDKEVGKKKSLVSILNIGTDNYVITEDNYKKMVLLVYRIRANVPVIIMGETGCGKTSLIIKLNQLLNNGEKYVEIINIHPGITDKEITKQMKIINDKAKKQDYIDKDKKGRKKELWIFFDEINTCLSLSLLTEIFINRAFNGEKLEENIRLIGACNPYRKRTESAERCGLTREDDKDDILVYKVEQLPLSLLYYVFSFGTLKNEDEKKYIRSIIQKLFNEKEDILCKFTTEAISKSHIFLRNTFNDPSIVSLREIARFTKCVEFFEDYFLKKNNQTKDKVDKETKKII
jgi:energy-coupling factor transporter ATP-binding protein EcfA2